MDAWPRQIAPQSFGRRLLELLSEPDCSLVWFLGAGCSISSGIPGAAGLVRQWLPRLKRREEGDETDWEEWAKARFESFDPAQPALLYGAVIHELFPLPRERQQEVERLTSAKEPSVGYALLAILMAHEQYGERTNIVVTTNFDDLVADSLYLLTMKKPLVVVHESLAPYARPSRSRPLIVKVHGDARLAPRNTPDETADLDEELQGRITSLLQGSGLIFCGYGGNDNSIARLIQAAAPDAFPLGIYWIGTAMPSGPVGPALRERGGVFHIPLGDFDALMIDVADALGLALPSFDRWRSLFDAYDNALAKQAKVAEAAHRPQEQKTADRLRNQLNAWRLDLQAASVAKDNPDRAEELYRQAVDADPTNALILNNYALFIYENRQEARAQQLFRRAIDLAPNNADILGNYALFLHDFVRDPTAEEFYQRAIDLDPTKSNILSNYALFLHDFGGDPDRAEELYQRAIESDPSNAKALGSYATFMFQVRQDTDRAEQLFRRAIDLDPSNADILGNYAVFLFQIRRDPDRAKELYQRAIDLDPEDPNIASNYAQLLFTQRRDDEAVKYIDKALAHSGASAALRLEAAFFLYAHVPARRHEAMQQLVTLLTAGERSETWDFRPDLDRAERDGDERLPFLTALAEVINGKKPLGDLDHFDEWREASQ